VVAMDKLVDIFTSYVHDDTMYKEEIFDKIVTVGSLFYFILLEKMVVFFIFHCIIHYHTGFWGADELEISRGRCDFQKAIPVEVGHQIIPARDQSWASQLKQHPGLVTGDPKACLEADHGSFFRIHAFQNVRIISVSHFLINIHVIKLCCFIKAHTFSRVST